MKPWRPSGGLGPPRGEPILSWVAPNLVWIWTGPNPTTWVIEQSTTAGGPFSLFSTVSGTFRFAGVPFDFFYRVFGTGPGPTFPVLTPTSNVVEST